MRSFTYSAEIRRTPEEVFAFMADLSTAPRWRSLVRRIELVGQGQLRQGAEVLVTIDVMGRQVSATSEVWAYEPPRRLGFRNRANGVTGRFEYLLRPSSAGTIVTFTCDIRPHGWMWLLLPVLVRNNRSRYADQLQRLRAALET